MALKPNLPRKIIRVSPWNRVHPTSPIWGSEGHHKAVVGIQGAFRGARITLSLADISGKLGCFCLSAPLQSLTAAWGSF